MAMNIDKARKIAEEMRALLEEQLAKHGYTMGITQVQHGLRNPNICNVSFTVIQADKGTKAAPAETPMPKYPTDYHFPKGDYKLLYVPESKEETYGQLWALYQKEDKSYGRMNCATGKRTKISDKIAKKLLKDGMDVKFGGIPKSGDQVICFDPADDDENVYHGVMIERVGKRSVYKVDLGMDYGNMDYALGNVAILTK